MPSDTHHDIHFSCFIRNTSAGVATCTNLNTCKREDVRVKKLAVDLIILI